MRLKPIIYVLFTALTAVSCTDSNMDEPPTPATVAISYTTGDYGQGLSRADNGNCWQDDGWNENTVDGTADLFLIKNGTVTYHLQVNASSNDCNTHQIIKLNEHNAIFIDALKESDHIAMVVNCPINVTDAKGSNFAGLYTDLSNLAVKERQSNFVMVGYMETPQFTGADYSVTVELKRVAAKIRVSLRDKSNVTIPAGEFKSVLRHYVTDARIMPDNEITPVYTTTVKVRDMAGEINEDGIYPIEITEAHPEAMIREEGHVYYTYPSDWINYSKIEEGCPRNGKDGHKNHDLERWTVADYFNNAPILPEREMFVIVLAPYEDKKYYYKVPVNFRLAEINNHLCFSKTELTSKILPLYRADRNHFYDVKAIIDRAGAHTPEEAATNPYFTATIAPLIDGGTFDYIYD